MKFFFNTVKHKKNLKSTKMRAKSCTCNLADLILESLKLNEMSVKRNMRIINNR